MNQKKDILLYVNGAKERIAKTHGSQCGFCTPGFVMSMYTLLRNNPQPTEEEIESACEGNLCRCTGYRGILDGFKTFSKSYCCKKELKNAEVENEVGEMTCKLYSLSEFEEYDPSQDLIFPPELLIMKDRPQHSLCITGKQFTWFRPSTIDELLSLKKEYPAAKLVVGNTEIGLEMKSKCLRYPVLISPCEIPQLNGVHYANEGIELGACISLTRLNKVLKEVIEKLPEYKTRVFAAIVEMLRWFGGQQIRNVGSIVGNIMNASPISDLNPLFLAAKAKLTIQSVDGLKKVITMDENFFTSYRKTCIKEDEIVISILIPYTIENEYFYGFKQARRRTDDLAIVNAGMRIIISKSERESDFTIKDCLLCFGGMAAVTVIAKQASNFLIGRQAKLLLLDILPWNTTLTESVIHLLNEDMPLPFSAPGGMIEFRKALAASFFFKFYLLVTSQISIEKENLTSQLPTSYLSACSVFKQDPMQSIQVFEKPDPNLPPDSGMRKPIVHQSALTQATGEAIYSDDLPTFSNELNASLVLSKKPHAVIKSIRFEKALQMPGVVSHVTAADIPGTNHFGPAVADDEVFATTKVTCIGHIIGVILADTKEHADDAVAAVEIEYEDLPAILTIEEAIEAKSFYQPIRHRQVGDVEQELEMSDQVIEGELRIGGQEHFYFETQSCLALPKLENGEMEIFASTQNPSGTQLTAARTLAIPANRVVCRVKRLGGGFGGKETRTVGFTTAIAVAAQKVRKPVRCVLERDIDMSITGTRHPFLFRYKVGFSNNGAVRALKIRMYSNAGNSFDLSLAVMERALIGFRSCYHFSNIDIMGYICKTNIPSNTAFRGFGSPQGMLLTETILNDVATACDLPPLKVREVNLHKDGDLAHYNMTVENSKASLVLQQVVEKSHYERRKQQISSFNRENRWKKRGIAVIPTGFPISYPLKFFNQGGALVMIYLDGSVLLSHGGTEMGQGLHTKLTQICSHVLGVPVEKVHMLETSTSSVPNTTPTSASVATDLNGGAVLNACEKLKDRIAPYQAANPKGKWEDWITAAYLDRVNLSANGFYRLPDRVNYDWEANTGQPFYYITYGAAVSEVEIDTLTGSHHIIRSDIVMDVGKSINPAIDIGQIEGAFMQGIGLFTLEEQYFSPEGKLLTRGPSTYKLPTSRDIPNEFYVSLLPNVPNDKAVFSSKGIGEPPLFLGSSVFFAIKDAINSARQEVGLGLIYRLDSPGTCERIRMACQDQITTAIESTVQEPNEKPWAIRI
ncbi:Xanthine dehydrogenase/oxidase [Trichoplax sp. H2]|nr:Xanthine dehydrogenase/oxidase [Trichoplax sp. H2]|eukprot:RDD44883.1 Xanthine dehydrogenase/oxidase [Trichoplax sp. H2]